MKYVTSGIVGGLITALVMWAVIAFVTFDAVLPISKWNSTSRAILLYFIAVGAWIGMFAANHSDD